jgi:putative endonuclease
VEVKFRRQSRYGFPREAVGYKKQQHIRKTALFYLTRYNLHGNDIRFDVVEVLSEQGVINIYHIENAF